MASSFFAIPAILFTFLSLSEIAPATPELEQSQSVCKDQNNNLICEVQQMKLKITHLESILEQSVQSLDMKFHLLGEKEKLIEEMTNKIGFLHTVLADIKVDSTYTDERISALEEEVKLLWATSRKNNFDIHKLESKAQITESKLQAITSKVRKMQDIVTEQWIQIRQVDQAFKLTEMRTLKAQRRAAFTRCTFLKFIKEFSGHYLPNFNWVLEPRLPGKKSVSSSYTSQALLQLKNIAATVKEYHHELQRVVKQAMEMNEFASAFANQEVIFFVASAIILFPVWVAWTLLLSFLS